MIEIIVDTKERKETLIGIIAESNYACPFYESEIIENRCNDNKCIDCVEKNIKWTVKEK